MRRSLRVAAALGAAATMSCAAASAAVAVEGDPMSAREVRASQWWLHGLGVLEAQHVTRGEGVTVCLVDTGVRASHPVFAGADLSGDGKDYTGTGSPDGLEALGTSDHGTGMAALVVGQGTGPDHARGLLGVAPDATLMSMSTIGEGNVGLDHDDAFDAVVDCVDGGADVVNISFVSQGLDRAVAYAQAHDVVVVAATGNAGEGRVGEPAGRWGVLSVTGVDESLRRAPAATYGHPVAPQGRGWVLGLDRQGSAVAGPFGVDAGLEVDPGCESGYGQPTLDGGWVESCGGTSGATAVVSGVVALVRAAHPDLNAANVVNRVIATAHHPSGQVPDAELGWGPVDAAAAVSADVPLVDDNPLGSLATQSLGSWVADAPGPFSDEPARRPDLPTMTPAEVRAGPEPGADFDAAAEEAWFESVSGAQDQSATGPSAGAVLGVLVGAAALVVLAVAGLVVFVVLQRRRRPAGAGTGA